MDTAACYVAALLFERETPQFNGDTMSGKNKGSFDFVQTVPHVKEDDGDRVQARRLDSDSQE